MTVAALLTRRPRPAAKWTLFIQQIVVVCVPGSISLRRELADCRRRAAMPENLIYATIFSAYSA